MWTNFKYHEGHAMPTASRNTTSWLQGSKTSSTSFLGQKSTLNAAKPASIPKAGVGSRSRAPTGDTPGPGQYDTAYSSIKKSGASIKGGPKKGRTRDTQLEHGARLDDGGEMPGHYEKLSTFGMVRHSGGSISKARRTINWMDKREPITGTAPLMGQVSSLKDKATPLIRSHSPRFQSNIEQTPGPGRYNSHVAGGEMKMNKGIRFDQSKRSAPVGSNISIHTWFNKSDIPGPADYAPKSVAEHKKERLSRVRGSTTSVMRDSVMREGSQYNPTPRYSGRNTVTPRLQSRFEFAPRSRGSDSGQSK